MLTKAVMSQLDAIVQKAESIVPVCSASDRVVLHLLLGRHDIALSMTRAVG